MQVLWRIALLGHMTLQGSKDGEIEHRVRLQKAATLLAYLALSPGRQHSREFLCELLWADEAPEISRNRLRVTLASLRRQLEPPGIPYGAVLAVDGNSSVGLRAEAIETDAARFSALLREGDDAAAVALYGGPLLPGLYESWVFEERERLQDAYLGALRRLAQARSDTGDTDGALEFLRRAAATDPLAEDVHTETIRLLIADGRLEAARRAYAQWERRLHEELDDRPPAAVRDLLKSATGERVVPKRNVTPSVPAASPPAKGPAASKPPTSEMPLSRLMPIYLTRFFGRETEQSRLENWLHDPGVRLITLTGIGGCGKTRLAVETARREAARNAEERRPVWFVPLADLWDARRISETVHQALALPRDPRSDPTDQVVSYLETCHEDPVLIFDNFEQLARDGAPTLTSLLQRIPRLTCLVTSRHRMDLPGEQELPLQPLPIAADEGEPLTLERLLEAPGTRLFVDRAQTVRPDFQVTARNAADIAAICRMLEGIPLAVELAAARAGALGPAQMRSRLADGWDVPSDRRQRREERHRSLRATLEWSYRLLAPDLRTFFCRLAVFRGGCDADSAEAICEEAQALDFLARLRATSLLAAEERAGAVRFRMLEIVREWAQERLSSEEQEGLAARHAAFFRDLAERAEPHLEGPEQTAWREGLEADYANLLTALDWAERHDPLLGLRTAAALYPLWYKHGYGREGRERFASLLSRIDTSDTTPETLSLKAKALKGAGSLAFAQGDNEAALRHLTEGLAAARIGEDAATTASILNNLGLVAWQQGDLLRADQAITEALAIRRAQGDRWYEASALLNLGAVARDRGETQRSRTLFEESLAVCRETGDRQGLSRALNNLGNIVLSQEDLESAGRYYEESAAIKRELGDRRGYAVSLHNLATIANRQGDWERARTLAEESLALHQTLQDPRSVAFALNLLGQTSLLAGDREMAQRQLTEGLLLRRRLANPNDTGLSLFGFARMATGDGDPIRAVRLLAASERLRTGAAEGDAAPSAAATIAMPPEERREFDASLARVRSRLTSDEFDDAWMAGRRLSVEEAITYALSATAPTTAPGTAPG